MNTVTDKLTEAECCYAGTVSGALDKARSALAAAGEDLLKAARVDKMRAGAKAVNAQVHRSPWPVIGGAAVLALAVGLLLGRR